MAATKRAIRLNSLLKEVISEVIRKDVKDPRLAPLFTVTAVEITNDLHHAKVHVSVIGTQKEKEGTLEALQSAAGFIAVHSSKKVVMRFFPALNFKLDESVEKHMTVDAILQKIQKEKTSRNNDLESSS